MFGRLKEIPCICWKFYSIFTNQAKMAIKIKQVIDNAPRNAVLFASWMSSQGCGYSHYMSLGIPTAYLFTDIGNKLPQWFLKEERDMNIKYMITSFLGEGLSGVEKMTVDSNELLVSSPECAIMECLNLPETTSFLLDIYYIMEGLTTLRPKLVQSLLETCTSIKVKRLWQKKPTILGSKPIRTL